MEVTLFPSPRKRIRAAAARFAAAAIFASVLPVAAAPFSERLYGTSGLRTDVLSPAAAISATGRILQNGIRPELPGPAVVARDLAGVEAPWSWHVPSLETTVIDWVRPCAAGGALIAGHRDLPVGFLASGNRMLTWVARIGEDGRLRWVSDLLSVPSSQSVSVHLRIVSNLWALPDCSAVAYLPGGAQGFATRLVALHAEDGAIRWTVPGSGLPGFSAGSVPVAAVGPAFVLGGRLGSGAIGLVAVDPTDGDVLWQQEVPRPTGQSSELEVGWTSPTRVALVPGTNDTTAVQARIHFVDHPSGQLTTITRTVSGILRRALIQPAAVTLAVEESTVPRLVRLDGNGALAWEVDLPERVGTLGAAPGSDVLAVIFSGTAGTYRLQRHAAASGMAAATATHPLRYGYDDVSSLPDLGVAAIHAPYLSHEVEVLDTVDLQLLPTPPATTEVAGTLGPVIAHGQWLLAASGEASPSGARIVVSAIDRTSGMRVWRRALDLAGTEGMRTVLATGLDSAADGTLLVGGFAIESNVSSPGYGARGVIARLSIEDGTVIERTPQDDPKAYRHLAVSPGGDIYASWQRLPPPANVGATIGRIVNFQPAWETTSTSALSALIATDIGAVVFAPGSGTVAGRLERLARDDGTVAWSVERTTALPWPEALIDDGPDTVALALRVRTPESSRSLQVEQFDTLTGQRRWLRVLDVGPLRYDGDASATASIGDGLLANWRAAPTFASQPSFAALARLGADGSLAWIRHYDIAPPGWSTLRGRFAGLPDGKVVVAWDADPDAVQLGATIRLNHLALVDLADGEVLALKALPTRFESSPEASGLQPDVLLADSQEVVFSQLGNGPNGLIAPTLTNTPFAPPTIGAPRVRADMVEISGPRRTIELQVHAAIPDAPAATRATLRIGLPVGLLASQVTCTADAGASCGSLRRVGAIAQEVELSGAAEVHVRVVAEVLDQVSIEGPAVAVLDPEDWMAAKHSRSRVVVVRVPFGRGPDEITRDSFDD